MDHDFPLLSRRSIDNKSFGSQNNQNSRRMLDTFGPVMGQEGLMMKPMDGIITNGFLNQNKQPIEHHIKNYQTKHRNIVIKGQPRPFSNYVSNLGSNVQVVQPNLMFANQPALQGYNKGFVENHENKALSNNNFLQNANNNNDPINNIYNSKTFIPHKTSNNLQNFANMQHEGSKVELGNINEKDVVGDVVVHLGQENVIPEHMKPKMGKAYENSGTNNAGLVMGLNGIPVGQATPNFQSNQQMKLDNTVLNTAQNSVLLPSNDIFTGVNPDNKIKNKGVQMLVQSVSNSAQSTGFHNGINNLNIQQNNPMFVEHSPQLSYGSVKVGESQAQQEDATNKQNMSPDNIHVPQNAINSVLASSGVQNLHTYINHEDNKLNMGQNMPISGQTNTTLGENELVLDMNKSPVEIGNIHSQGKNMILDISNVRPHAPSNENNNQPMQIGASYKAQTANANGEGVEKTGEKHSSVDQSVSVDDDDIKIKQDDNNQRRRHRNTNIGYIDINRRLLSELNDKIEIYRQQELNKIQHLIKNIPNNENYNNSHQNEFVSQNDLQSSNNNQFLQLPMTQNEINQYNSTQIAPYSKINIIHRSQTIDPQIALINAKSDLFMTNKSENKNTHSEFPSQIAGQKLLLRANGTIKREGINAVVKNNPLKPQNDSFLNRNDRLYTIDLQRGDITNGEDKSNSSVALRNKMDQSINLRKGGYFTQPSNIEDNEQEKRANFMMDHDYQTLNQGSSTMQQDDSITGQSGLAFGNKPMELSIQNALTVLQNPVETTEPTVQNPLKYGSIVKQIHRSSKLNSLRNEINSSSSHRGTHQGSKYFMPELNNRRSTNPEKNGALMQSKEEKPQDDTANGIQTTSNRRNYIAFTGDVFDEMQNMQGNSFVRKHLNSPLQNGGLKLNENNEEMQKNIPINKVGHVENNYMDHKKYAVQDLVKGQQNTMLIGQRLQSTINGGQKVHLMQFGNQNDDGSVVVPGHQIFPQNGHLIENGQSRLSERKLSPRVKGSGNKYENRNINNIVPNISSITHRDSALFSYNGQEINQNIPQSGPNKLNGITSFPKSDQNNFDIRGDLSSMDYEDIEKRPLKLEVMNSNKGLPFGRSETFENVSNMKQDNQFYQKSASKNEEDLQNNQRVFFSEGGSQTGEFVLNEDKNIQNNGQVRLPTEHVTPNTVEVRLDNNPRDVVRDGYYDSDDYSMGKQNIFPVNNVELTIIQSDTKVGKGGKIDRQTSTNIKLRYETTKSVLNIRLGGPIKDQNNSGKGKSDTNKQSDPQKYLQYTNFEPIDSESRFKVTPKLKQSSNFGQKGFKINQYETNFHTVSPKLHKENKSNTNVITRQQHLALNKNIARISNNGLDNSLNTKPKNNVVTTRKRAQRPQLLTTRRVGFPLTLPIPVTPVGINSQFITQNMSDDEDQSIDQQGNPIIPQRPKNEQSGLFFDDNGFVLNEDAQSIEENTKVNEEVSMIGQGKLREESENELYKPSTAGLKDNTMIKKTRIFYEKRSSNNGARLKEDDLKKHEGNPNNANKENKQNIEKNGAKMGNSASKNKMNAQDYKNTEQETIVEDNFSYEQYGPNIGQNDPNTSSTKIIEENNGNDEWENSDFNTQRDIIEQDSATVMKKNRLNDIQESQVQQASNIGEDYVDQESPDSLQDYSYTEQNNNNTRQIDSGVVISNSQTGIQQVTVGGAQQNNNKSSIKNMGHNSDAVKVRATTNKIDTTPKGQQIHSIMSTSTKIPQNTSQNSQRVPQDMTIDKPFQANQVASAGLSPVSVITQATGQGIPQKSPWEMVQSMYQGIPQNTNTQNGMSQQNLMQAMEQAKLQGIQLGLAQGSLQFPQGAMQTNQQGIPYGMFNGMSNDPSYGMSYYLPQGMAQGTQYIMPQGTSQAMLGIPGNIPQIITGGAAQGSQQMIPQDTIQAMLRLPQVIPGGMAQGTQQMIPQGTPQAMLGIPGGIPQAIPGGTAQGTSQAMLSMPQSIPQVIQQGKLQEISQNISPGTHQRNQQGTQNVPSYNWQKTHQDIQKKSQQNRETQQGEPQTVNQNTQQNTLQGINQGKQQGYLQGTHFNDTRQVMTPGILNQIVQEAVPKQINQKTQHEFTQNSHHQATGQSTPKRLNSQTQQVINNEKNLGKSQTIQIQGTPQGVTQGLPQIKRAQPDITQKKVQGIQQGVIKEKTEGKQHIVPQTVSQGRQQGMIQRTSQGTNQGIAQKTSLRTNHDLAQGLSEGISQGSQQGIQKITQQDKRLTEGINQGTLQAQSMPQDLQLGFQNAMRNPNSMPNIYGIPFLNGMPQGMPQDMSLGMFQGAQYGLPQDMYQMPQGIPQGQVLQIGQGLKMRQSTSEQLKQELPQQQSQRIAPHLSTGIPQQSSQMPGQPSQEVNQQKPQTNSQQMADGMQQNLLHNTSKSLSNEQEISTTSTQMPQFTADTMLRNILDEMSHQSNHKILKEVPQEMMKSMQGMVPSNWILEKLGTPEAMDQKKALRMSERTETEAVTQDIPKVDEKENTTSKIDQMTTQESVATSEKLKEPPESTTISITTSSVSSLDNDPEEPSLVDYEQLYQKIKDEAAAGYLDDERLMHLSVTGYNEESRESTCDGTTLSPYVHGISSSNDKYSLLLQVKEYNVPIMKHIGESLNDDKHSNKQQENVVTGQASTVLGQYNPVTTQKGQMMDQLLPDFGENGQIMIRNDIMGQVKQTVSKMGKILPIIGQDSPDLSPVAPLNAIIKMIPRTGQENPNWDQTGQVLRYGNQLTQKTTSMDGQSYLLDGQTVPMIGQSVSMAGQAESQVVLRKKSR